MRLSQQQSGQTLIALLIFMMLAMTITISSAVITVVNLQAGVAADSGETALGNASTGAENALLRLERQSGYNGETMTLPHGTATISVSGTNTKTITSVGHYGKFSRTVTVTADYTNNILLETSWTETP